MNWHLILFTSSHDDSMIWIDISSCLHHLMMIVWYELTSHPVYIISWWQYDMNWHLILFTRIASHVRKIRTWGLGFDGVWDLMGFEIHWGCGFIRMHSDWLLTHNRNAGRASILTHHDHIRATLNYGANIIYRATCYYLIAMAQDLRWT
jgi:hypothetical protein